MRLNAFSGVKGAIAPAKPTVAYTGTGTFTITNYDPALVYVFTLSAMSAGYTAPNGAGVFTLNNVNSEYFLQATRAIGAPISASQIVGRREYGQYWTVTQAWHCDCCGGSPCGGCCGGGTFHACTCDVGGGCGPNYLACCECGYYTAYNFAPYVWNGTEWYYLP